MRTVKLLLAASVIFASFFVEAQTATWRQVSAPGTWTNTVFASATNGTLLTIEQSGKLYKTDPVTAVWSQISATSYANTVLMFAGGKNVFTIEKDGTLYRTNPESGDWVLLGNIGEWAKTIAGVAVYGYLYTVKANGILYATNVNTGIWHQVGKAEFGNTKYLFDANGKLFSIEKDGSLYEISQSDGSRKKTGVSGAWVETIAGTTMNGKLYTIENDGSLFETDLSSGIRQQIGVSTWGNTRFMVAAKGKLYIIEASGALHEATLN